MSGRKYLLGKEHLIAGSELVLMELASAILAKVEANHEQTDQANFEEATKGKIHEQNSD